MGRPGGGGLLQVCNSVTDRPTSSRAYEACLSQDQVTCEKLPGPSLLGVRERCGSRASCGPTYTGLWERPSRRPRLLNEGYWDKSFAELLYIVKDARQAAQANRDRPATEAKYLDQHNDACTVLGWRRKHHLV